MNHDPTVPALNDPPLRSSDELSIRHDHVDAEGYTAADGEHPEAHDTEDITDTPHDTATTSTTPAAAALKPWEERLNAKRKAALDTLFNTLDSLVYLELVVLYCFECVALFFTSHSVLLPSTPSSPSTAPSHPALPHPTQS